MRKTAFVFDTVSLSNFLLAEAVQILIVRYSGRAFITDQVFAELAKGARLRPRLKKVENLIAHKHFTVISMTVQEYSRYTDLIANLGSGEASSVVTGLSRGYTVVTDDRVARMHCTEKGVDFTGTIGILKAACLDKQVTPSEGDHILRNMVSEGYYSPVARVSDIL